LHGSYGKKETMAARWNRGVEVDRKGAGKKVRRKERREEGGQYFFHSWKLTRGGMD